jgi:hypothetical protein
MLLAIALLMMRTRLPPRKLGSTVPIIEFLKDPPYLLVVSGLVYLLIFAGGRSALILNWFYSSFLMMFGIYFPVFYLQLYAVTHGVDWQFAFYCVCS